MEGFQSMDAQTDIIKYYFKRYLKLFFVVLAGFFIVSALIVHWQKRSFDNSAAASDIYQKMLVAQSKNNLEQVNADGESLIKDYAKTTYAQFAALILAKNAVDASDLNKAEQYLRWAIEKHKQNNLTWHVANLRLAALLQSQGKLDDAAKLLSLEVDNSYLALYEEARGDLYFAQNDLAKAKDAYQKAMQNLAPGANAPLLQMKLQDLGVAVDA